jgi:quercetin dioxygenase-like cupin family protein
MQRILLAVTLVCLTGAVAKGQDAVKVDSKHYKVESENAQVRVLRIHYGPHEKSAMHSHPDSVVVFLSDARVKFTMPDGKTQEDTVKAGEARFTPAGTHLPENLGDQPMEGVLVELKGKPAAKPM